MRPGLTSGDRVLVLSQYSIYKNRTGTVLGSLFGGYSIILDGQSSIIPLGYDITDLKLI